MYLVTGSKSGLGQFLQEELKAVGFTREDKLVSIQNSMERPFDAIIHCAFNLQRNLTSAQLSSYINDNLWLTQQLLRIPHQKFIFISSADVYPKQRKGVWQEDDEFPVDQIESLYGLSKLMAEAMVSSESNNYLILRPTALLGIHSRPNSLIRLLKGTDTVLTLSASSTFNYILHQDVLQFIQNALAKDLCGIFNLAANISVSLGDVAAAFNSHIQFGSYVYQVASLCNKKARGHCEVFANSSFDNIKRFQPLIG